MVISINNAVGLLIYFLQSLGRYPSLLEKFVGESVLIVNTADARVQSLLELLREFHGQNLASVLTTNSLMI